MANVDDSRPSRGRKAASSHGFRYINPNISLEEQGYYHGFPCHLGHTIRDSTHHWCYHCAVKIRANICGCDVNFIQEDYRHYLYRVIQAIQFESDSDPYDNPMGCWHIKEGYKAPSYPSWRSFETGRLADRVQPKKILYQAFWGDVGKLYVTTASNLCGDERCVNPLHTATSLNSSSNRRPSQFQYLDLSWNPTKHTIMALRKQKGKSIDDLLKQLYRPTIRDPKIEEHMQTRQDIGNDKPERISTREITTESP